MKYNSLKYWNNRPNPNRGLVPEEVDKKYIPDFIENTDNLFEFGVGVARMFPFYTGKTVTGLDFASQYAVDCIKKAKEQDLKKYTHTIHNIHKEDLPFEDKQFERGLLIKVLLHAPEDECRTILTEVGRVSDEVLLISYNGQRETLASHCFYHDYKSLIEDLGGEITFLEEYGNQIIIKYKI